jgi:hypothetical protein
VSNTTHFNEDMAFFTDEGEDDSEGEDRLNEGRTNGKKDVRRGIDDYLANKRQRDEDNFLFDD